MPNRNSRLSSPKVSNLFPRKPAHLRYDPDYGWISNTTNTSAQKPTVKHAHSGIYKVKNVGEMKHKSIFPMPSTMMSTDRNGHTSYEEEELLPSSSYTPGRPDAQVSYVTNPSSSQIRLVHTSVYEPDLPLSPRTAGEWGEDGNDENEVSPILPSGHFLALDDRVERRENREKKTKANTRPPTLFPTFPFSPIETRFGKDRASRKGNGKFTAGSHNITKPNGGPTSTKTLGRNVAKRIWYTALREIHAVGPPGEGHEVWKMVRVMREKKRRKKRGKELLEAHESKESADKVPKLLDRPYKLRENENPIISIFDSDRKCKQNRERTTKTTKHAKWKVSHANNDKAKSSTSEADVPVKLSNSLGDTIYSQQWFPMSTIPATGLHHAPTPRPRNTPSLPKRPESLGSSTLPITTAINVAPSNLRPSQLLQCANDNVDEPRTLLSLSDIRLKKKQIRKSSSDTWLIRAGSAMNLLKVPSRATTPKPNALPLNHKQDKAHQKIKAKISAPRPLRASDPNSVNMAVGHGGAGGPAAARSDRVRFENERKEKRKTEERLWHPEHLEHLEKKAVEVGRMLIYHSTPKEKRRSSASSFECQGISGHLKFEPHSKVPCLESKPRLEAVWPAEPSHPSFDPREPSYTIPGFSRNTAFERPRIPKLDSNSSARKRFSQRREYLEMEDETLLYAFPYPDNASDPEPENWSRPRSLIPEPLFSESRRRSKKVNETMGEEARDTIFYKPYDSVLREY